MASAPELLRPMSAAIQRFTELEGRGDGRMDTQALAVTSTVMSERQPPARPDIDRLARQIYDRIRYRLLADAERLGRQKY